MSQLYNDLVLTPKLQSTYSLNTNARSTRFHALSEKRSDLMLLYLLELISFTRVALKWSGFFYCIERSWFI